MRRSIVILGALGVVLLTTAALWLLVAPGALVTYPDDLNKTAVAKGTVSLYVDPDTGAPTGAPQTLPLSIERNLRVVESTGSEAVVLETSTEQIGPQTPLELRHQYVIDRSTLKNLADPQAYAYAPDNVTDRSGAYSINLPFATGDGPYPLWKNETGTSYAFRQSGDEVERNGLTLTPMSGRLTGVAATDAYIEQLKRAGIRTQTTLTELAPQIGIDPAVITDQLLPALSSADRATIQAALTAPAPINYLVSVHTRLLVEPTTGAIVSLDHIDQTLSALPDLSSLEGLAAILAKPQYADEEIVQTTLRTVNGLTGMLPVAVMKFEYGQTPASVANFAAYTQDKATQINLIQKWIPLAIAGIGMTAAIIAAVMLIAGPSRTRVAA
jgi:hypothetical protein